MVHEALEGDGAGEVGIVVPEGAVRKFAGRQGIKFYIQFFFNNHPLTKPPPPHSEWKVNQM